MVLRKRNGLPSASMPARGTVQVWSPASESGEAFASTAGAFVSGGGASTSAVAPTAIPFSFASTELTPRGPFRDPETALPSGRFDPSRATWTAVPSELGAGRTPRPFGERHSRARAGLHAAAREPLPRTRAGSPRPRNLSTGIDNREASPDAGFFRATSARPAQRALARTPRPRDLDTYKGRSRPPELTAVFSGTLAGRVKESRRSRRFPPRTGGRLRTWRNARVAESARGG